MRLGIRNSRIPKSNGDITDGMMFSKKYLRKLIIPVVAETLLAYLIGMMDTAMVSYAGETAVSAVSMVDSLSVLFINIFSAFGTGGAVVCGQYLGAGNTGRAKKSAGHLTAVVAVLSAVVTFLLLFLKEWLLMMLFGSAEDAVLDNCRVYYGIVMLSVPFIALYNSFAAVFRITGDSKTPLKVSVLMNVVNICGNAVLIYGFKMGVMGVAIPTLISRGLACIILLVKILSHRFELNIRQMFKDHTDIGLIRNILSIGLPNGIEDGMFQMGRLLLISLVSTLTTASIAANAVGNNMAPMHSFIGIGIKSVIITVVSQCVGAGNYEQARWYTRYLAKKVYIIQGIYNAVLTAAIPLICRMYNLSEETAAIATQIQLLHGIGTIVLWPSAFLFNTTIRAAGDSRYVMWVSSLSMWLVRVLGAVILVKFVKTGVIGVWIAWLCDWMVRTVFFVRRYRGHKWETMSIVKETT